MEIIQNFWAKKDDSAGSFKWLPLYQHLTDTAMVAGLLWEHWLSNHQKKLISGVFLGKYPLNFEERGKNLVMFLTQIHDIGKATPAFQIGRKEKFSADLDKALLEKLEKDGFTGISSAHLPSRMYSPHALAGEYILKRCGVNDDISSIVGAHHGKPADYEETVDSQSSYESNYYQVENPDDKIHQKWRNSQEDILKWALESNDFEDISSLPEIPQNVQVIISGLTIMSDWIASNEHYFPLISIDEDKIFDLQKRIEYGWKKWKGDIKTDLWQSNGIDDINKMYKDRFNYDSPRAEQRVLSETIGNMENPGIVIFEAAMGCGKTEAALIATEQLSYKKGLSGMFFGLPTQATSNGIFHRVLAWLDSVQKSNDSTASIRLSHGKSSLNEEFTSIAKNINVDEEEFEKTNQSVIVNEWFSGRKTSSLDDFVVGTVDHFLLLALKQKHLALRHLGFTKKVVIIDEVHAYDTYMSKYLLEAIEWLGAYQIPVLLLSATLPAERREKMIKSYLQGYGVETKEIRTRLKNLKKDAYPLITYTDGNSINQNSDFEKKEKNIVKIIQKEKENIYEIIDKYMSNDVIIGIILNTVKSSQEIAKKCEELYSKDNVFLLHSSFIATDRKDKETQLTNMIGKDAGRPERKIIIGTQVMEQSLDIDFDVLITDLAPMDLLIQRIGRLHRHDTVKRKPICKNPITYVLGASESFEFEKGSAAVYDEYILARTQYFLPDEIHIPSDISKLVQKVYDSNEEISLNPETKRTYDEYKSKYLKKSEEKRRKADVFCLEEPIFKDTLRRKCALTGWLRTSTPNESEERAFARVRDIDETIEVIALKKIGEGYGFFGSDEDISSKIGDLRINKEVAKHTLTLPKTLSVNHNIDKTIEELEKFNIKNLINWQNETWLSGLLGIIFDEKDEFYLNGYKLKYSAKYGLSCERSKEDE